MKFGKQNPNYRGGKSKCIDCEKVLAARYSWRKGEHRCRPCLFKFRRGENHPHWKGGALEVNKSGAKKYHKCIDCSKPIYEGNRCRACFSKTLTGETSPHYKPNLTNYRYLHAVMRKIVSLEKCEHCGVKGVHFINKAKRKQWTIELANKSGNYLRDISDWLALCKSCHKIYDLKHNLLNTPAKLKLL